MGCCRSQSQGRKTKTGLLVRLTFPAYDSVDIDWGIAKLKQVEERF